MAPLAPASAPQIKKRDVLHTTRFVTGSSPFLVDRKEPEPCFGEIAIGIIFPASFRGAPTTGPREPRKPQAIAWKGLKRAIWEVFGIVEIPADRRQKFTNLLRFRLGRKAREYVRCYLMDDTTVDNVDERRETFKKERKAALKDLRGKVDKVYKSHRPAPAL